MDLVLCDVMMPERDRTDFYRRLQQVAPPLCSSPEARSLPARAFVAEAGYELLEKPIDEAQLAHLIESRTQHRAA